MATKFIDVSAYQPASQAYFEGCKSDGAKFAFVKTTEGTFYVSSSAYRQLKASKNIFGTVGVYHFWHGESAAYFLGWLRAFAREVGFKLSDVKVALDVEAQDLPWYCTADINAFESQLVHAGIKPGNIWTYVSASWLNAGRVRVSGLKYGFTWVAMYPYSSAYEDNKLGPYSSCKPAANAWQFSGLGNQDWNYDYTGTLVSDDTKKHHTEPKKPVHKSVKKNKPKEKPVERKSVDHKKPTKNKKPVNKSVDKKKPAEKPTAKKPAKPNYWKYSGSYEITSPGGVNVYSDYHLTKRNGSHLGDGTILTNASAVSDGVATRLHIGGLGFITGNAIFVKLLRRF